MSPEARTVSGLIIITIPTIQFGGAFLLSLYSHAVPGVTDSPIRLRFFTAGHAHAGVIVMLALIFQPLVDVTTMAPALQWLVRLGTPLAAILMSAGFFAAVPAGGTKPGAGRYIIVAGAILLALSVLILGIGLITAG
jgi:hypothetical protein